MNNINEAQFGLFPEALPLQPESAVDSSAADSKPKVAQKLDVPVKERPMFEQPMDIFEASPESLDNLEPSDKALHELEVNPTANIEPQLVCEDLIGDGIRLLSSRMPGKPASREWQFEAAWFFNGGEGGMSFHQVCQWLGYDPDNIRDTIMRKVEPEFREELLTQTSDILNKEF